MAKSTWNVDTSHSHVGFSVKHMMFTTVRGSFKQFSATVVADPEDLTNAEIDFSIETASVNTGDENRDNHLRSGDFFDVENHPQITFHATSTTKTSGNAYDMTGDLTIRGVTKPVTFHVTYEGTGKNPWGAEVAGFSATTTINRKDFGLTWNAALETGGVLVSDQVKIELDIQASKA
ncbi:polyisoprenoid-binding protein YceI [Alicyclobacillus sacchari]|uniref:Polyisoprenoid-binding protein YceI n=1 Tax=Alicyclobacillus sacchari TaxID=392010 RepID=A0A4R8LQJ7_9BACL|nr:YceI family protein [Alicyclobacillus sacchari]TDY49698.1 polyisoprenoid-binding protein YceI [Alicyclobacillus sacchari]GMA58385.1 polyisoprenoid-binding protein [Alicyclobacillus sacchari]